MVVLGGMNPEYTMPLTFQKHVGVTLLADDEVLDFFSVVFRQFILVVYRSKTIQNT
jgi:hypothetical protein